MQFIIIILFIFIIIKTHSHSIVPKTTERYQHPTRAPYRPAQQQPRPRCHSSEFQCANGDCVPMSSRCNNRVDCRDRSDELSCRKFYVFILLFICQLERVYFWNQQY